MPVLGQTPVRTHWEDSEAIVFEKIGSPYTDPNDSTKLVQDVKIHRLAEVDVNASTSVTVNGKGGTVVVLDDASPAASIAVSLDSSVADGFVCDVINESTQTATFTPTSGDINDGGGAGSSKTLAAGTSCRLSKTSSGSPAVAHWRMLKGAGSGGSGDVTGPASSTADNFVQFNGTTGKIIKDGGLSLDTDGTLAADSDSKVASQKAVKTYVDGRAGFTDGILGIEIGDGVNVPNTGDYFGFFAPYSGTISGWTLGADASGSAQITVKKSSGYSGFPTTTSIVASAPPVLSSVQKNQSSTLTGWTTAFTKGDFFQFNLDSVTTCKRLTLVLQVTRSS